MTEQRKERLSDKLVRLRGETYDEGDRATLQEAITALAQQAQPRCEHGFTWDPEGCAIGGCRGPVAALKPFLRTPTGRPIAQPEPEDALADSVGEPPIELVTEWRRRSAVCGNIEPRVAETYTICAHELEAAIAEEPTTCEHDIGLSMVCPHCTTDAVR